MGVVKQHETNGHAHDDHELTPLASMQAHAKKRKQPRLTYQALNKAAADEHFRRAVFLGTKGESYRAHQALDDAMRAYHCSARLADMHLKDLGTPHQLRKYLETVGILTVRELANCHASAMISKINVMDLVDAAFDTLRRIVALESE